MNRAQPTTRWAISMNVYGAEKFTIRTRFDAARYWGHADNDGDHCAKIDEEKKTIIIYFMSFACVCVHHSKPFIWWRENKCKSKATTTIFHEAFDRPSMRWIHAEFEGVHLIKDLFVLAGNMLFDKTSEGQSSYQAVSKKRENMRKAFAWNHSTWKKPFFIVLPPGARSEDLHNDGRMREKQKKKESSSQDSSCVVLWSFVIKKDRKLPT